MPMDFEFVFVFDEAVIGWSLENDCVKLSMLDRLRLRVSISFMLLFLFPPGWAQYFWSLCIFVGVVSAVVVALVIIDFCESSVMVVALGKKGCVGC